MTTTFAVSNATAVTLASTGQRLLAAPRVRDRDSRSALKLPSASPIRTPSCDALRHYNLPSWRKRRSVIGRISTTLHFDVAFAPSLARERMYAWIART